MNFILEREEFMSLTILVMSCDKYFDTWKPFITCFRKYFPACPYQVALSTECNSTGEDLEFDYVIYSNKGEWSARLKDTLRKINSEYVFMLLDDFWLDDYIDTAKFQRDYQFISTHENIGTIYINYERWRFLRNFNSDYYEWEKGNIYRANTRPAFWKKEYLEKILDELENVWQFERIASDRTNCTDYVVLCSKKQYLNYIYAVTAGKYEREAIELAEKEGIVLDTEYREKRNICENIYLAFRSKIFSIAPECITRIKMKIGRRKLSKCHRS